MESKKYVKKYMKKNWEINSGNEFAFAWKLRQKLLQNLFAQHPLNWTTEYISVSSSKDGKQFVHKAANESATN